jgi:hypothetical protein
MLSEIRLGVQPNWVRGRRMWLFLVIPALLSAKFMAPHPFVVPFVAAGIPIFWAVDSRFVACLNELAPSSPSFTECRGCVPSVALPLLFLLFGIVGVILIGPDQSFVLGCASGIRLGR